MNIMSFRQLEDDINAKGHTQYYNNQPALFDTTLPEIMPVPFEELEKEETYEDDPDILEDKNPANTSLIL